MSIPHTIVPAVAAAIFNEKGEILLQKRRDVNQWCIISGHVEYGETVAEAILREIEEEMNVQATIKRLIGIYSSPDSQTYHYPNRSIQYVTTYFEVTLNEDFREGFSNEETECLEYFPVEQLPQNLAQLNEWWLQDALSTNGVAFVR
ncbi:MAG: NUDIX domain-containing protein [Chitinophagaceae bacterium]